LALNDHYPFVMNGRVADTSKRRISRHLVGRDDAYDGPVIVKTNLNFGGMMEALLAGKGSLATRVARSLRYQLPWALQSRLSPTDYRIFSSIKEVPRMVWHNPDLVVERFLSERHGRQYCLRVWMFLGNRETNSLCYSEHPVVKSGNITHREVVPEVPSDLRRLRHELGFDFGKFDYAIVDGQVILYDANRTPSLGGLPNERTAPTIRLLAEGIQSFL
jgi:hypothetical protein